MRHFARRLQRFQPSHSYKQPRSQRHRDCPPDAAARADLYRDAVANGDEDRHPQLDAHDNADFHCYAYA